MFLKRKKDKSESQPGKSSEHILLNDITAGNLKQIMGVSEDIVFREMHVGRVLITVMYIDGLINSVAASDYIFKPLSQELEFREANDEKDVIRLISSGYVYYADQKVRENTDDLLSDLINGSTALIFDNEKIAITFGNKGFEKRGITEPTGENVMKGSKDSFVENLRINTSTIRTRIKSKDLLTENMVLGTRTRTSVDIIYMSDIASRDMVEEIRRRLKNINIDGVLTIDCIEEYIVEKKFTTFPQILYTERPDKFCSNIIEGRVGLLVEGIPFGYILPCTLLQCIQAPEDYSMNYLVSSVIRLLRFFLMIVTLFVPSFFISITTFHQEMIPTELAISIQASKQGVPFYIYVEVILMLVAFEVLVEAGLRLPRNIGQTVSVVGAVIIGQALVSAKLISPAVVVIIAITAISSFSMPNQDLSNALRLWRFILVIFSSVFGLFGLILGALYLLHHLSSMEMLGVPYLSPFVSNESNQFKDSVIRWWLPSNKYRPDSLKTNDKRRQE